VEDTAPGGIGGNLGAIGVDLVPVVLPETSVEVDLVNAQPTVTLPEVAGDPEEQDDGDSKKLLDNVLGVLRRSAGVPGGVGSRVDGGDQNQGAESKTNVGANDTTSGLEGDAVQGATLASPGSAEANVGLEIVSIDAE